jgi:hypothetical protein
LWSLLKRKIREQGSPDAGPTVTALVFKSGKQIKNKTPAQIKAYLNFGFPKMD